ncbi:DnaD domain-containing protein [Peribacillus acanthi]|uniref:DnaD domain-containing protein n=1 Tax=Peribacillus acanthi TaxID=2171554 RepID=UPI000D3E302A|nr:DnaD domain protein [Peribacillus acanthi]
MAKYRHVHVEFWQDPKVLEEMTPEDKYFYLYLLTNPNTTQIGVYQITKKQMAFDLGYSTETINSLLERFRTVHKLIKYNDQTRELAIVNWGKYNLNKAGKPVIDCIKKELSDVKDKTLLWEIMNNIPNETITNEFSRYVYDTYHDTSTTRGQKEKEKEKEKEVVEETPPATTNPIHFYESEIGRLSPLQMEELWQWVDDFNGQSEIVIEAIKIALDRDRKTVGFIKFLLKQWKEKNAFTLNDVQALEKSYATKINIRTHQKQNELPVKYNALSLEDY